MQSLPDRIDTDSALRRTIEAVQHNCHIADARHARDMTMCNYLLEMREFFRWEQGIAPGAALPPRGEIAAWLSAREALWDRLGEHDFVTVPVEGVEKDAFAVEAINAVLKERGLLYGAGIGRFGKSHFFLGECVSDDAREGVRIVTCGREYARDLSAIPAVLYGEVIVLRQEALHQWLWGKIEAWQTKRADNAMKTALECLGYDVGSSDSASFERMAAAVSELLVLHELGEQAASHHLGHDWERMLAAVPNKHTEILARAIRDNLADCLVTLPVLLERGAYGLLHFWFANFDGMRRALFPGIDTAYRAWREDNQVANLDLILGAGRDHWYKVGRQLLGDFAASLAGDTSAFSDGRWASKWDSLAL